MKKTSKTKTLKKPYSQLGNYLKEKRETAGLSQKDVSQKLGYTSTQFISNWERGLASPPLVALAELVQLYKINKAEFMDKILEDKRLFIENEFSGAFKRNARISS